MKKRKKDQEPVNRGGQKEQGLSSTDYKDQQSNAWMPLNGISYADLTDFLSL